MEIYSRRFRVYIHVFAFARISVRYRDFTTIKKHAKVKQKPTSSSSSQTHYCSLGMLVPKKQNKMLLNQQKKTKENKKNKSACNRKIQ